MSDPILKTNGEGSSVNINDKPNGINTPNTKDWEESSGRVYIVQDEFSGHIKIGFSRDVKKRINSLTMTNPKLLGLLKGGRGLEMKLHQQFKKSALGHELFRPDKELLDYIKGLGPVDWNLANIPPKPVKEKEFLIERFIELSREKEERCRQDAMFQEYLARYVSSSITTERATNNILELLDKMLNSFNIIADKQRKNDLLIQVLKDEVFKMRSLLNNFGLLELYESMLTKEAGLDGNDIPDEYLNYPSNE